MIIILEGIDKCGKSTLAKQLCIKFKATLIKTNAPKTKNAFDEYISIINKLKHSENYVFDRFYLGEMAYGPTYRKKSTVSEVQQFYLESLLIKFNPVLIYCWLDYNLLCWNFEREKEESTRFNDVPKLAKLFDGAFNNSTLPKLKYNYSALKSFKMVIEKIKEVTRKQKINPIKFSYAGHLRPDVLFVGDEPNYQLKKRNRPYGVFNSSSGMFLFKVLSSCKLKFGVINSREDNKELELSDIKKLKPKQVVCLGKKAHARVLKKLPTVKAVVHPQFANRFYGKAGLERYKSEIMEASSCTATTASV